MAQRRGFRGYLAGLLAPRERNKTLTALTGAEPVTGSKLPAVQRLQFFLSESRWDLEAVNARRLELLRADPATAPHGGGVLVIDDSGDRKDGTKTAHVGRQYLGRYGKTGNGVVTVTTLWADERVYYPVHAVPYTPARHFAKGKNDPGFRAKLAIGAELAVRARAAGFCFRAVVADSAYGDQDGFRAGLAEAGPPFVMALRPHRGTWARAADARTPVEAARALAWGGPEDPGDWHPITRTFRDGHAETWRAANASLGGWGPDGVRNWTGQSYKQVKDELGWADFQVRSDIAIRRHQALVNRAFSFCWDAWFADHPAPSRPAASQPEPGRGERGPQTPVLLPVPSWPRALRAVRAWLTPWTVLQRWWTAWSKAPPAAASPDQLSRGRPRPAPLHSELTDYR